MSNLKNESIIKDYSIQTFLMQALNMFATNEQWRSNAQLQMLDYQLHEHLLGKSSF